MLPFLGEGEDLPRLLGLREALVRAGGANDVTSLLPNGRDLAALAAMSSHALAGSVAESASLGGWLGADECAEMVQTLSGRGPEIADAWRLLLPEVVSDQLQLEFVAQLQRFLEIASQVEGPDQALRLYFSP